MDQHCIVCQTKTDLGCARCQESYCSHLCQKSDWSYHKLTCFPMRWGAKLQLATTLDGFVNISKQTSEQQLQNVKNDENSKKNPSKLIWNLITSIIGKEKLSLIDMSIESSHTSPKYVIRIFGRILICADVSNPTINFLLGLVGKTKLLDRTTKDSYITGYKLMLQYEMEEEEMQLKKIEKIDVKLTHEKDRIFYFPITEDMLELSIAIDKNQMNQFILKPKTASICRQIIASIKQQKEGNVYIEIRHWDSFNMINTSETYSMQFEVNSKNFEAQTNALKFIDKHDLFDCLIDNPAYKLLGELKSTVRVHYQLIPGDHQYASIQYHEKRYPEQVKQNRISTLDDTDLNSEQKTAVENIVNGNNYPLPYLLYGPPGTGKTKTLVAAIEEIVRTTTKNILVCAMSNAACDEITERLLIGPAKLYIYRMYATSYNTDNISSSIKEVCMCNLFRGKLYVPHLATLYDYQVIICTLSTAGWMSETNAHSKVYRADHFQYVFIDECASSHETMTLIPISGLCTSLKKIHANIVLSGDPKQLPAVTKSRIAEAAGFNISWMEHLLALKLYKRSSKTGKFNEVYITQLVQNYRSHAAILKIPNELFYNGQLKAKASSDTTDWFINSNILPSKNFPIIFESVKGFSERSNDKSLFNLKEIDVVIAYISKLLQTNLQNNQTIQKSDIGVLTPYKTQCKKIVQACRYRQWNDITIGTSEAFQGKEKPIMIVSTVRADGKYLGFTKDPRRMNVVITRAKCLLIIVGDPHTLKLDDNWAALIKYCLDNNSLIQSGKRVVM